MENFQAKPIDRTILKMMGQLYEEMLAQSDPDSI